VIQASSVAKSQSTPISPEISTCDDCLREFDDSLNRRFHYPFMNCTNCGPRFTIVEDIPFDRPSTTMKTFGMCDECQAEYDDPDDRRFHAQPNACPECGPRVWFLKNTAAAEEFEPGPVVTIGQAEAIEEFHRALDVGQIVAVKGIGGFHLACDATNASAIANLRARKGRSDKPFAVMVHDVEQARSFAIVTEQERRRLESKERPIVLLTKKDPPRPGCGVSLDSISPGNNFIGVMLPYSPLHHLLIRKTRLVLTSGNLADEPIARTNAEAWKRLRSLADGFLLHNREIHVVCDDSVVRCVESDLLAGDLLPIRRSRGYAPMPIRLPDPGPGVLAVGGEIKSSFCLTKDNYAYLSQHIGDMGNLDTLEAMRRSVWHFLRLFRADVQAVAADLHPGYLSGQWARELAGALDVPLVHVQHHLAHIVGLMAESNLPVNQQVIGCCFDGTGYGPDGAIWGGEFLVSDQQSFHRFAHLKYSPLPGGDAGIRRPYRIALAQLWAAGLAWDENLPCVAACPRDERKLLRQQLEKNLNCVSTSSMGRLFDVVASLIGIRHEVNYEAQAAMELEALASRAINDVDPGAYRFTIRRTSLLEVESTSLLRQICTDIRSGIQPATIAAQFHHAVANLAADVCQSAREEFSINTVGLTGGVFQNVLLVGLIKKQLHENGFQVLTHSIVPPNDGGLALGQAVVARNRLKTGDSR
jgi:hydrogenase maturation protein HypF